MAIIPAVLPILCFLALVRLENFRETFLKSALVTALFIALSTELLSFFNAVAFWPLVVCWTLFLAAAIFWRYRRFTRSRPAAGHSPGVESASPPAGPTSPLAALAATSLADKLLLGLIACIVVTAGITAVVAAPNNFDSLTYHFPRVMHWIQNKSVAHYPTNIDRQLVMAPLSEYIIMHLQILAGCDRFANCVQWFAMVGSAVGVSLIARALKGSVTAQIVAAAVAVSLPMGLLQASSTQNDYSVTFWLVCLASFIFDEEGRGGLRQAFWIASALALAIFTKGTAYFVAFPFMLLYLWRLVAAGKGDGAAGTASRTLKRVLSSLAVIGLAVVIVNGSHLARNFRTFGNPLAHGTGNDITCTRIDPTAMISCVTRNVATQLSTGLPAVDRSLYRTTASLHRLLGVDINDRALTADDDFMILGAKVRYHEDYAPNPVHMLLLLAAAGFLVVRCKKVPREMLLFSVACMAAFVLLSAFLKWTPYLSRYFIPIFVLSGAVLGCLSDAIRPRLVVHVGAALLLCSSFFVLTDNFMRPLVGPRSIFVTSRVEQYFMARPESMPYLVAQANMVKAQPLTNVGLACNGNTLEYLLWALLNDGGSRYRIEHVEVKDASGAIRLQDFSSYYLVSL